MSDVHANVGAGVYRILHRVFAALAVVQFIVPPWSHLVGSGSSMFGSMSTRVTGYFPIWTDFERGQGAEIDIGRLTVQLLATLALYGLAFYLVSKHETEEPSKAPSVNVR